jgi:hypothetical protein
VIQKIKQAITILAIAFMGLAPVALPATVGAAEIDKNLRCGANLDATLDDCDDVVTSGTTQVNSLISTVINIFSLVVGVVAVIMIIVGGFRYITSGGDSNNVSAAKNTILYAIIGLVIVALAQFIVRFVLERVTTTTP